MTRAQLAAEANAGARQSRIQGAPVLSVDSTVETLCEWLQWNDPNGCHTAQAWADERPEAPDPADPADVPYTLDEAWQMLATMVEDS